DFHGLGCQCCVDAGRARARSRKNTDGESTDMGSTPAQRRRAMRWTGRIMTGLWALAALTWAPPFGEAADATVTGIGRFFYQKFIGTQSVEIGIKHARVEMCDDDG